MVSKTNTRQPGSTVSNRKPIFDAIRAMLGRSFRQTEVDALDHAFDQARNSEPAHRVSAHGIALIKRFEGCALLRPDGLIEAYPDPGTGAAPWTIGWGATRDGLHGFVGPDTVWTQAQADQRLEDDLIRYSGDVASVIGSTPTSQMQFDAMVSFHYNTGAIGRATLAHKHSAGDFGGAAGEFQRWNKAGGKVLKGLTRRRMAEAQLYATA